jgi:hypothetical protein
VKPALAKAWLERMENQTSDLVEPGGVGRAKVKMDVLAAPQPTIVFGLMGVQVVQDDVDLPARMFDDDSVHEMKELDAPAARK